MAINIQDYAARITVTDGAWGTEMQKRGLAPGACPELWNTANPDAVEAVARSYVEAGSDVILSNTFGANAFVLARHDAADRSAELAEAGVAISRRAARDGVRVFASMGPTGQIVMMGDVPPEKIHAEFASVAAAMERGGADAIVVETMTEIDEVALAVRAVNEATRLPVIVSLTYDSGPDRTRTMMGTTPGEVVEALKGLTVAAFGANCGAGPEHYIQVVQLYRQATTRPIWIKANAGLPIVREGQTTFPLGPEGFAAFVPALIEAGACFLGGCCGTTPAHIAAVRATVDRLGR